MMRDDLKYEDIVAKLNDMAETIASELIPDGKRDGGYWRGDLHGKCSVHIRGARAGMCGFWQGQAGNAKGGGNLIHLIELAMGFKTHGEAVRFAKEKYLGIRKRELTDDEKRQWARQQESSKQRAAQRAAETAREVARKVDTVRSIWQEATAIAGTPAEAYLRSRSIDMPSWPPSLRFHPGVMFGKERYMALIGGVQAVDRRLTAIWRIAITPDGKPVTDDAGNKIKLGFGPATGGAVRFGLVGPTLVVAEGMETALGVLLLTRGKKPVWSLLSTSGMIGFDIPSEVKRLEIYADGDRHRLDKASERTKKPPGIAAAEGLKAKAEAKGIEVVIYPSPEPDDWLDVWISRCRDERQQRDVERPA